MIEVFRYKKDKITKVSLDKVGRDFVWIRLVSPDEESIRKVSETVNIPLSELQESLTEEERPRLTTGRYTEIIYRAPHVENNEVTTFPLYIYLFKQKIITIEKTPLQILRKLSADFKVSKSKYLFKKGIGYFVFHVLDKINDNFLVNIDKIAANIDVYEEVTKRELTKKDIERIYEQSVTLSFFNQALIANIEVLNGLRKGFFKQFRSKDKTMFEELYYDALQILDTEKIQREAITNLFNLQSIIASSRLNEFMKKLTSLALLIAIPTMISGLYGMNFVHIPLKDSPFGFYITSAAAIIITMMFYYFFKKSNWV